MDSNRSAVVIMAAGKGTRMKNPEMAKVMYEVNGKPLIGYVVELALRLKSARIIVVVGYRRETVIEYLRKTFPGKIEFVEQREQLGTGHAVMQTESTLRNFPGDVIVLSGDVPLLTPAALERLQECHRRNRTVATILTADIDDPKGYGRIISSKNGLVESIIEERDADEETRKIREINSGIYIFQCSPLLEALKHILPHNAQNEYYLTDVFKYFWNCGLPVAAVKSDDFNEIRGVNTFEQLKESERILTLRNVNSARDLQGTTNN